MLVRIVAAIALCLFMVYVAKRATLIPGRLQSAVEFLLEFVRKQIVEDVLGEHTRKYLPMLTAIFFSILAFNLTGVIPGMNMAATSLIGLPLMLAVWVYLVYLSSGFKEHGFWGYLRMNLFPPGVPPAVYPLLAPLEALQIFVTRPVTLAVRLTTNMVAGHLLLVLCFSATHALLLWGGPVGKSLGVLTFAGGLAITLFEMFVAVLQAFIFTLLSSVYISTSLEEH